MKPFFKIITENLALLILAGLSYKFFAPEKVEMDNGVKKVAILFKTNDFEASKKLSPLTFIYRSGDEVTGELLLHSRSDLQAEVLFRTLGPINHICNGHVIFTPFKDEMGYYYDEVVNGVRCKMSMTFDGKNLELTSASECHSFFCGPKSKFTGMYEKVE